MGKIGKWEKAKSKTLFKWGMFQFLEANGFLFGENMLVDWNKTDSAIWQNYSIQLSYELALVVCVVCFFHHSTLFSCRVCVCAVEWLSGWLAPVAKAKMNVSHEANREDGKIKQCFERILSCCRHNPKGERAEKMSNKKRWSLSQCVAL